MGPLAQHRVAFAQLLVSRAGWRGGVLGLALLLQACGPTAPPMPMTMPIADGRDQTVNLAPREYVVNRRERGQYRPGVELRVTRVNGRDLDYSDGLRAKKAVQAYCDSFHRQMDPRATGRFSTPNAWVYDGDCL